jgi:DNA-binding NtrC family response regulator
MNKTEILVIGRNEATRRTVIRLINDSTGWNGVGARNGEDAIEKFHQRSFDMVLLANDIAGEEEKKLRKIFTYHNPDLAITNCSDTDGDLLKINIARLLNKRPTNKPTFSFVDDALKNARLNINIE